MSRRAKLPGAEELFRRTSSEKVRAAAGGEAQGHVEDVKSTNLQVARAAGPSKQPATKKVPRHEEKVTIYCTKEDLMGLETVRLKLRGEHGIAADRGKIVRAALGYVLDDFEARGQDSILLHCLGDS